MLFSNNDKKEDWSKWKTFQGRNPKHFNLDPNWHKPWPMWKMVLNTIFIILIALIFMDCRGPEKEAHIDTNIHEYESRYTANFNRGMGVDVEYDAKVIHRYYRPNISKSKTKHLLIYIHGLCENYDVNYELAKTVVGVESGWKTVVKSSAGAIGLMQIMPSVAKDFNTSKNELKDPYVNITLGVKLLSKLARRYENDAKMVLIAYNEGPSRADKMNRKHKKAHNYANKVIEVAYAEVSLSK
ncbi:lytic transglycosylase domain-containing protein [bacterium]|nr:lytic transglycosylase domain-containing protein [bacterium]